MLASLHEPESIGDSICGIDVNGLDWMDSFSSKELHDFLVQPMQNGTYLAYCHSQSRRESGQLTFV